MQFNIKVADKEDWNEDTINLVLKATNEAFGDYDIDEEHIRETIWDYLHSDNLNDKVFLLLRNEFHNPIGFLMGFKGKLPMFKGSLASELCWYVDPNHRGHGKKLIEAYEYWAKHISKCDLISVVSLENGYSNSLDKFYTRQGFKKSENFYLKEIN